jgi:hypothetical protein
MHKAHADTGEHEQHESDEAFVHCGGGGGGA